MRLMIERQIERPSPKPVGSSRRRTRTPLEHRWLQSRTRIVHRDQHAAGFDLFCADQRFFGPRLATLIASRAVTIKLSSTCCNWTRSASAKRACPFRVHTPLWDHFQLEVCQLFQKPDVLQKRGAGQPGRLDVGVVADGSAGRMGQIRASRLVDHRYARRRRRFFGEDGGQPGQRDLRVTTQKFPRWK